MRINCTKFSGKLVALKRALFVVVGEEVTS